MNEFFKSLLAGYIVAVVLAVLLGITTRIAGENCKIIVADYVFLGLTRLTCEIK